MKAEMEREVLEKWREAGRIASDCREWARETVRPGVLLRDVLEGVEAMMRERGGVPAFPAQTSRNHIAAHYCSPPDDETRYEEGDCVKVDFGVHVDGYVADTAATFDLSSDGRWSELIQASADALAAAIETLRPDVPVREIGAAVEQVITGAGFEPVRNLTGHGLDRWKVHTAPQIPSYAERTGTRVKGGSVVAIEPFSSTGRGMIHERGKSEVFMLVKPPSRAKGLDRDVIKAFQSWRGLPIARRYFTDLDQEAVEAAISKLAKQGSLIRFPPLVEDEGVMIAQTEHSLYVGPDGVEVLTR